jgi:hypothetical protein
MFKTGDKVTWVQKDTIIPHPQGRTDREGNILPVFGDKVMNGRIIDCLNKKYQVRPDWAEQYKDEICGAHYYDKYIKAEELSLL